MATITIQQVKTSNDLGTLQSGDMLVAERVAGAGGVVTITATGTGSVVLNNTPTLISPILGTPTSGTLTNCVGLPLSTGTTEILSMSRGGTAANLTASNGGIVYTDADSMEVLAGTATASKMLLSSSNSAPTWSTSTIPTSAGATTGSLLRSDGTNYAMTTASYPNTTTSGTLLGSTSNNVVTVLTDIPTAVTIGSAYVYRASGTDVPVADGGTGVSSLTAYGLICGGTTSTGAVQALASLGSSGQVLTSNGVGALPTWQSGSGGGISASQSFAINLILGG